MKTVLLCFLASVVVGCAPMFVSKGEEEITGRITADGHCAVDTPRGSFAAPPLETEIRYNVGGAWNVTPAGYVVHNIACYVKPMSADMRYLMITLVAPAGSALMPGTYRIDPSANARGDVRAAEVTLRHPAYDVGTPGAGRGEGGHILLTGVSGEVVVTRVDSVSVSSFGISRVAHPSVEAHFRMRAKREWGM